MTHPKKPLDLDTTSRLVFRGGSWDNYGACRVRAADPNWYAPTYRSSRLGFRCALRGREPLKVTP